MPAQKKMGKAGLSLQESGPVPTSNCLKNYSLNG